MQSTLKKFAVLGDPIAHSQSPQIHLAFAKQFNLDISYERIQATVATLEATLQFLQDNHYCGVNLTSPLKEIACQYMDELSIDAKMSRAINTVTFLKNGKRRGDNTDGTGLRNDLCYHQISLKDKNILLFGAGGAVRGILPQILADNPANIFIHNRTANKVAALAYDFSPVIQLASSDLLREVVFDLCIDALPDPMMRKVLCNTAVYYDLRYADPVAKHLSPDTLYLNGLGMLIEQAAHAFSLWNEQKPDTKAIRDLLK